MRPRDAASVAAPRRPIGLQPQQAIVLPLAFVLALFALTFLPRVWENAHLWRSLVGADVALLAWITVLFTAAGRQRRTLLLEIALRKQHYLQACAQASVFLYWGWYWREVYDYAPLIVAQLAFAYAFDILLGWSRRDIYTLGFGPFPVIFSINLFMWFKPDWFYYQFLLIAIGFAAKEFIRWNKDGKQSHIFNPSSFPLAVVSVILILTHTTAPDVGTGDRGDAVPSATHLPAAVSGRLARAVLLRRHLDDDVGGGDDVRLRAAVSRDHRHLFLLRNHPDRRVPRHAPAVHRPVDLAAHRGGPNRLRGVVRTRRCRPGADAWASTTSCCRCRSSTCRSS